MKAIVNTFQKSDLSYLNGLTFDLVGHTRGFAEMEIENLIIEFPVSEIIIVDIAAEYKHSQIRFDKLGFDYWFQFIRNYMKINKIKVSLTELPKRKIEHKEIETNFVEIEDNEIL